MIQQIKKKEKFKNLAKKSIFLCKRKNKKKIIQTHRNNRNQRISYNFRPRKQYNINSCESSDESSISSFIPSRTSTQSEYPSISHNHTYNRETSSIQSSFQKAQSTIDSTSSKDNVSRRNTPMENMEQKLFRQLNTKYIKQHPNNSMFDPLQHQQGVWTKTRLQRYFLLHMSKENYDNKAEEQLSSIWENNN